MGNKSTSLKQRKPPPSRSKRTSTPKVPPMITEQIRDLRLDYEYVKLLGEGHFGKVRLAQHKTTKQRVAIKSIMKSKLKRLSVVKREIDIMKSLDHDNIVKYLDVYEDKVYLHIVMEACLGGELFDRLLAKGTFSEWDAAVIIRQILCAVEYLHGKGIAHRDIKPENFLFEAEGEDAYLKAIDFGLSQFYHDDVPMNTRVGTPYYIAPEVLSREYHQSCDLWSVGIIMYIMLCGYPPFWGDNDKEIFKAIKTGEFSFPSEEWASISVSAKSLICKLLTKNPKSRITATQAIAHPWVDQTQQHARTSAKKLVVSDSVIASLKQFATLDKFKRTAFHVIARTLFEHEIRDLRPHFAALDIDGDGAITAQELSQGIRNTGVETSVEEVERLIKELDVDGDGMIDYQEFLAASMERHKFLKDELLMTAFNHFDSENTGKITIDALKNKLDLSTNPRLVEEIVKQVDKNGDGLIDFQEFKHMMHQT